MGHPRAAFRERAAPRGACLWNSRGQSGVRISNKDKRAHSMRGSIATAEERPRRCRQERAHKWLLSPRVTGHRISIPSRQSVQFRSRKTRNCLVPARREPPGTYEFINAASAPRERPKYKMVPGSPLGPRCAHDVRQLPARNAEGRLGVPRRPSLSPTDSALGRL